ncbi:hypothetical protein O3M35_003408 [Rhynocoris fuscipes]|uniref:Uncharacterized protein n=1 Tax=Rhynocoris fuscipes TaxID=488301 RepID=A0AAW1CQP8_9HEMI
MSEAFKELVKKRGILKTKLNRFQTFLSTFTDDSDVLSLTVRLENLHEIFKEFDSIQTSIEMTDINDPEIIAEREAFEDQYYEYVAKSKRLIAYRTNSDKPESPKTAKGEASQILSSLEITCSNYTIAWDLLKERYDNKKLIINSHIKSIFDPPNWIELKQAFKSTFLMISLTECTIKEPVVSSGYGTSQSFKGRKVGSWLKRQQ